MVDVLLNIIF